MSVGEIGEEMSRLISILVILFSVSVIGCDGEESVAMSLYANNFEVLKKAPTGSIVQTKDHQLWIKESVSGLTMADFVRPGSGRSAEGFHFFVLNLEKIFSPDDSSYSMACVAFATQNIKR